MSDPIGQAIQVLLHTDPERIALKEAMLKLIKEESSDPVRKKISAGAVMVLSEIGKLEANYQLDSYTG